MKIFIGSSSEQLDNAKLVARWLEKLNQVPILWENSFPLNTYSFDALVDISNTVDAAIFIFGEDDKTWYRKNPVMSVRDNVLLEYGFFSGKLSRNKVVFLCKGKPQIASDLQGITYGDLDQPNNTEYDIANWINSIKSDSYDQNNNFVQDDSSDKEEFSLYIDAQISAIKNAKKSIYISMDSLNPESSDPKLVEFDRLLENAKNNNIVVRIITRTGTEPERSRGAYDMCEQHDLRNQMKFSGILNAKALRCTLIDDEEIIISCSKGINKGFSKKYKHFYNEKANEILKAYIDKEYNRHKALTYEEFIFNRLDEMGVISKETSIKRASELLDIPESSLIKILDRDDL